MMDASNLKEYRCTCGKLLFKGLILVALIEIKCKRCRTINHFQEEHCGQNNSLIKKNR